MHNPSHYLRRIETITFTQEKIDVHRTAFTLVGAHLHLAHRGKILMRIRPLATN